MSNHLTLSDRIVIERGINNELTFATIARMLDGSPSSISREVKRYRVIIQSNHSFNGNDCTKRASCLRKNNYCKKPDKVYFSLGDKEAKTRNALLSVAIS